MLNRDFSENVNLVPFGVTMPDGIDSEQYDSIYSIPLDRPAPSELCADHAGIPVPSPDGRSMAYFDFRDRVTRIERLSDDGRGRRVKGITVWDWTAAR